MVPIMLFTVITKDSLLFSFCVVREANCCFITLCFQCLFVFTFKFTIQLVFTVNTSALERSIITTDCRPLTLASVDLASVDLSLCPTG